jgi:hypothetical protein
VFAYNQALCAEHMEDLPIEIVFNILGRLTDTRSIAYFAMASSSCRMAVARADLIRRMTMPVLDHRQVMHPSNVLHAKLATPKGFNHCMQCDLCKCLIPVPYEAVVINHKCINCSHQFPMWTNMRCVLYRGHTQHLPQPVPCSAERLDMYNVPQPTVYPYTPLHHS